MTDREAQRRAHEVFDPIADGFLERDGVDIGRMFASEGLRVRGKIFALVSFDGDLMLKLPEPRTAQLVETGTAERVVMRERPMREWVTVSQQRFDDWAPLIEEAYVFLDEITP